MASLEWWLIVTPLVLVLTLKKWRYYNFVFQQRSKACTIRLCLLLAGLLLLPVSPYSIVIFIVGVLANDEWMRNVWHHRTIYFCGVDGSGKSSHAQATAATLRSNHHLRVSLFHFYKNPVTSGASALKARVTGRTGGVLSRFRAYLTLVDNMLYVGLRLFWDRLRGVRVTVADRHLYDYYLRFKLLGYPVMGLGWLYKALLPHQGVMLDVDTPIAYSRRREHPVSYYERARVEYATIAIRQAYPVVSTDGEFTHVQCKIMEVLT